jgi:hypothetical protein
MRPDKPGWWWFENTATADVFPLEITEESGSLIVKEIAFDCPRLTEFEVFAGITGGYAKWIGPAHPPQRVPVYWFESDNFVRLRDVQKYLLGD